MAASINCNVKDNLMCIHFNRPEKMNAINLQMYVALNEAFNAAQQDVNVHALLIGSTSDHFTAGNDLADFLGAAANLENSPITEFLNNLVSFSKPLIAAVKGNAVGIGTTLLLHCDLVYAREDAVFATPFTSLGLVPEAGSSYLLPKLIGNAKANKLLLLGESMTAQEAEAAGLISEICDTDGFDEYVLSKALKAARLPRNAALETKALLHRNQAELGDIMELEIQKFAQLLKQDEFKSIAAKFLAKK